VELFHIILQLVQQLLLVIFRRADIPVTSQILGFSQVVHLYPMSDHRPPDLIQVLHRTVDPAQVAVSLDWLVGNTNEEFDAATLQRIQDIDKLSQKDKELVFEFLDSIISNRKIKKALS